MIKFYFRSRTLSNRIIWSIIFEFLIFGFTAGLAVVDSSQWIPSFFWITMISVIAISIFSGIYQNCIYGVVAALPPKYLNVVVTGMNLSGVVSAICAIISMAAAPRESTKAIAYFTLAVVFLIVCLVTYLMLLKNAFFVHYMKSAETNDQEERGVSRRESTASANPFSDNHINGPKQTRASSTIFREKVKLYMHILKQIWHQLLNIFFVYYVSLLLFPAVLGKVTSVNKFAGDYFGSVFCFLSFNLFSALGNLMLNYVPKIPAKYLWIPVLARLAFIPFFLYCNFDAENRISVVLFGDWVYSIGVVIFALNTGYLSSLAIYYAPKLVEPEHASLAGMMSSFSIMVGIMAGIFSSLGLVQFVSYYL